MKTLFLVIIAFCLNLYATDPILDHYETDVDHPPSGKCSPGSHDGHHIILFVKAGYSPTVIDKVAGTWQVDEGSETSWSLAEVSGGDKKIPKASGTMKGKMPIIEKIEEIGKVIEKLIKSINIRIGL